MVYLICYDLKEPNDSPADYERLIKAIHAGYTAWRLQESAWILDVDSSNAVMAIRDHLQRHLKSGDQLFVTRVDEWAANGTLPKEKTEWLSNKTYYHTS